MTTKATAVRTAEGMIQLPDGLQVRPVPIFQVHPAPGHYVLAEFPLNLFPNKSERRRQAQSGEIYLTRDQVNL